MATVNTVNMDRLLQACVTQDGSDIHIVVGRPPVLRIHGRLRSLETKVLEPDDTAALMKSITPDRNQQELQEEGGTDYGFAFGDAARFRVSVFRQKGNISMVLRLIPTTIMSFEQIGLPKICSALCRRPRGLFLVTGPTGSGKTTTLACMVNYINENLDRHIITVEDPIEYYHPHKKSIINQREVGIDVPSFGEALRRVLRMDPDVILVGELRMSIPYISRMGAALLSYLLAVVVFFLLYFILPNTKVNARAAIWGAAVAALVWTLARWGFGQYVTEFIPYSKVYGVVGLVPLAVFWVFITWLVVLFGLQVTYTTQHLSTLDAADIAAARKTDKLFIANDITAINVVRVIANAFEQSSAAVEAEVLCGSLDLPPEFGRKILDQLVEKGIIVKTSEPAVGYVPAREPENIKLSEIADAVADVGFAQSMQERGDKLDEIVKSQRTALENYSVKQILRDEKQETKSLRPKAPARKRAKAKPASNTGGASVESPAMGGLPRPIADSASDSVPKQTEGSPTQ